jgi:hypothetical protein
MPQTRGDTGSTLTVGLDDIRRGPNPDYSCQTIPPIERMMEAVDQRPVALPDGPKLTVSSYPLRIFVVYLCSGNSRSHEGSCLRATQWINGLCLGNTRVIGVTQALRTAHTACI